MSAAHAADALREALRDCFVEGYRLAIEHARVHLKRAGIEGVDAVLDTVHEVAATVEAQAAIAKAGGKS